MNLESPKNNFKEFESRNTEINVASVDDIQGITLVQKENLLLPTKKISEKELEKRGFLIHEVSTKELEKLILDRENGLVLVAKEGDEIKGYVLAYDLKLWKKLKPKWEETVKVSENTKQILDEEKILYLRHIARKMKAEGTGSKLMKTLINEARLRKYHSVIAEILEKPITNRVSVDFHKQFGFEEIGRVEENKNLVWNLFLKNITKEFATKEQNL